MIFQKIKIQNFFSFGPKEQELILSDPGLYLITGKNYTKIDDDEVTSNGAGKSSLVDSITFALFGKITKKDVNLPNIVNEQIGKNCKVELYFNLDGQDYVIQRFRGHEKQYDRVYFYKDGIDKDNIISKANINDTQEEIEKLLKFNYKSFINAVMMSQENISGFLQNDTSSAKRKEIIENILQLNNITKYHWIAQQKRKIATKECEYLEREEVNAQNMVKSVKTSITEYLESCKTKKKHNENEIKQLKNELNKINKIDIEREKEKLNEADNSTNLIEQKMTEYQYIMDEIKNLEKEVENIHINQDEYKSFMKNYVEESKNLKSSIKKLKKKSDKLQKELDEAEENPEKCPVCKGEINQQDHLYWIQQRKEEINNVNEEITLKDDKINVNKEKISDWMIKAKELERQKNEIKSLITEKQKIAKEVKHEYQQIEIPQTMSFDELQHLSDTKHNIEVKISEKENVVFIDESYLDGLKNQIKEYKQQLSTIIENKQHMENKSIILKWWETALSSKKKSMKTWCINNIIGYFNARIKYYVDRFFNGEVELTLDNDLNETIKSFNYERSFGQFSGGEKRRLNLAVLFALNSLIKANVSTKINIMFLDEILSSHLDEKGVSTVLELLEEMKEKQNTVYVIDHRDNFKDYPSFQNIQVVKQKDGYSYINKE